MESDIEFGKVEHSQPKPGLRPDQDKHFAVVAVGPVDEADLPIYVDMDVLRDMEAHARENTRVELGGVMLGRQHLDDEGNPFVVISDSLRAKHYEATKGSFKFTHETWNQITRERNEYRSDLEMVGWYHTHPGWGVFLSGMDLFICDNFFSRPLDVALVVEPCAGERGWFQWENGQTRQTGGFFLTSNRHRIQELNYFSDIFNNQNPTIADPRFRQPSFSDSDTMQGDSMVNVIDNRRPVFELAIVSMLFLQMLMAGIFGYRLLYEIEGNVDAELAERVVELEQQLDDQAQATAASIREQAYANILDQVVAGETGQAGLVEKYADIAAQNQLLVDGLEGQRAQIQLADQKFSELNSELVHEKSGTVQLRAELTSAEDSVRTISKKNTELKAVVAALREEDGGKAGGGPVPGWLLYGLTGLLLVAAGAVGGVLLTRRSLDEVNDDEPWDDQQPPTAFHSKVNDSKSSETKNQEVPG